jgi:hypothetical protein
MAAGLVAAMGGGNGGCGSGGGNGGGNGGSGGDRCSPNERNLGLLGQYLTKAKRHGPPSIFSLRLIRY